MAGCGWRQFFVISLLHGFEIDNKLTAKFRRYILQCHTINLSAQEPFQMIRKVLKDEGKDVANISITYMDNRKRQYAQENIDEFKARSKTRFSQDNFIESIDFDYLEIQVLEE